jgi:thioredoxin-like negative regulator of GroEL
MDGEEELATTPDPADQPFQEPGPEPDLCDPKVFTEAVSKLDKVYVSIVGDNCHACDGFKTEVRKAEGEIPIPILEVSADQCPRVADHYGARVTPTVVRLERGKVVATYEGAGAIEKMKQGL